LSGAEGLKRAVGRSSTGSGTLLTSVIEKEIIPRLLLVHRDPLASGKAERTPVDAVAAGESEAFAKLVLRSEYSEIMDQVQALIDRGVSLRRIYLDLLAPVARRLGEFWEEDRCTFTDVTVGLSRLHQVLREIGRRNGEGFNRSMAKRRIYLVPSPGEQHTFGMTMIEEFFLHAGWETASDHTATSGAIMQTLAARSIDVIGFSVGCEEFFGPLNDLIKRAHQASLNRNIAILVGGRLFLDHPDFASKISGAKVVFNGVNAVVTAENLVSQDSQPNTIQQQPS
jgi:methanogenic corrinoid protein MtbC1